MRSVELFVGAGGLGIGLGRAGFSPAAVIERDRFCCDTIRQNQDHGFWPMSDWPLWEGDIRDFDYGRIDRSVDLVSGGPPCQPFSLGGKHRGHMDNRDMFPEAVRALRELRPRAFLFENVKGLTRAAFADYLEYIKLQMTYPEIERRGGEDWLTHFHTLELHLTGGLYRGLHYKVSAEVLNAANYGVPQRRERVFFVGIRADLGLDWSFPPETHSLDALLWDQCHSGEYWERHGVAREGRMVSHRMRQRARKLTAKPNTRPWKTVRDAIGDLPDPEFEPLTADKIWNHHFQAGARSYPGHTGSPLDEPAKTLKAGVHGVPGGENMLLPPDGKIRYFSVRESARLQTFPDEILFHGSWTETMRQLGNAVPVELAETVAMSIRSRLESSAIASAA